MNWKNLVLLFTLFFIMALSGCEKLKEPEYREFKNFRIDKMGMDETTAKMDIVYYNPNSIGFWVKSTELDVYINNNFVGHTAADSSMEVPANSEFVIPVSARLNLKTLFNNALTALLTKEITIKISGSIRAGKAGFYKNFPIQYEGKQEIRF
jgi:LEA14-like dessication related protein